MMKNGNRECNHDEVPHKCETGFCFAVARVSRNRRISLVVSDVGIVEPAFGDPPITSQTVRPVPGLSFPSPFMDHFRIYDRYVMIYRSITRYMYTSCICTNNHPAGRCLNHCGRSFPPRFTLTRYQASPPVVFPTK